MELGYLLNQPFKFKFEICLRDSTQFISFTHASYKNLRFEWILLNQVDQFYLNHEPTQKSELGYFLNSHRNFKFKIYMSDSMFLIRFAYVSYKHERFKHISMNHSGQLETNYVPAQQSELVSLLNLLVNLQSKFAQEIQHILLGLLMFRTNMYAINLSKRMTLINPHQTFNLLNSQSLVIG